MRDPAGGEPVQRTERGLDRIVFFSDAVTAIAITLLVLPLVDYVPEAAARGTTAAGFLEEHGGGVLSFVISFLVIGRLWVSHHAVFEHASGYSPRLRWLSVLWALSIALLPLPTAMWQLPTDRLTVGLYSGTMLAASALTTAIVRTIRDDPAVESADLPVPLTRVWASYAITGVFALGFVVGVAVGDFWTMLLLVLIWPVTRWARQRADRRERSAGADGSEPDPA